MASRNNDRTVSGKAYAWRLLGMMPAISKAATVAQTTEWRAEWRTRLYHSCIDILVDQINYLTGRDMYVRYADKLVLRSRRRRSRVLKDVLSMDGDEVSTATMCAQAAGVPGINCRILTRCSLSQEIRTDLQTERARLLNQDGTARERCKDRVG